VTLDIDGPLSALGAATGETVRTYERTQGALEVVYSEGTLFVVAGDVAGQEVAGQTQSQGQRPGLAPVRPQRPEYLEKPPSKTLPSLEVMLIPALPTRRILMFSKRMFLNNPMFSVPNWRVLHPLARKQFRTVMFSQGRALPKDKSLPSLIASPPPAGWPSS
jgi:hypothetical protein